MTAQSVRGSCYEHCPAILHELHNISLYRSDIENVLNGAVAVKRNAVVASSLSGMGGFRS